MFGLRPGEIILILLIVLLLFGAKRLPDTARSLGRSLRILKSETKAMRDDDDAERDRAERDRAERDRAEREHRAEPPRPITARPQDVTEARPVGETDRTDR
jgi:sec-independent protein translocase protein TatA